MSEESVREFLQAQERLIEKLESENKRLREALEKIAKISDGIKPSMVDWKNCVSIAKQEAKEALEKGGV